jgi:hypothetical protein
MKRFLIITIAALTFSATQAHAQSWLDALKGVATTAIDKATGGSLTAKTIIGTWKYSQPGVKLSSENTLSELTAAAATTTIQKKIAPYYEIVGIKAGICKFVINEDGTFSSTFGQRTFSGTYTFEPKTNALSLKYGGTNAAASLVNMGAIPAYAYMNGDKLQIVFPMDKLLNVITSLGSSVESLSTITELFKSYDSMKIGFEFTR